MKKYLLLSSLCLSFFLFGEAVHAESFKENNNSNIYLAPTYNNFASDIITLDWCAADAVPLTYWAVHNFTNGYAGFQDRGEGHRTFHFSLWDHIDDTDDKIKVEYVSPLTDSSPFGGEGTGRKASTDYPWL